MKASLTLYLRLLATLRPYRAMVGLSVLAMLAAAALEPALPALLKPLVDESMIAGDRTAQWQVPLLLLTAFVFKGIADYLSTVSSQWIAHKAVTDLRCRLIHHQLHLPLAAHQAAPGGRMLSRVLYDVPQVGAALSTAWVVLVRDSLMVLGLLAYLFYVAWELALLMMTVAPVVAWLLRVAGRKLRGTHRALQETTARFTGLLGSVLNGLREIKLYAAQDAAEAGLGALAERQRRQTMRTVRVSAVNAPLVQVVAATAVCGVIWVATLLSADNRLTPGEFVAFVAAMAMLFEPIRRLSNVNAVIQRGLAGAQSVFELLDMQLEPAATGVPEGSAFRQQRARGELVFERVEFAYPGQQEAALRQVDLHVEAGETVAVLGASGSGKSTLLSLIAGFQTVQGGRILLDGAPLDSVPLDWLRSQVAWVGQPVVLFDDTVAANIALGRPEASLEDIERAARAAQAWDFILTLPHGLETVIGPDGSLLSGGQRQRIAIARAFLKDAPILLLDEATSALDAVSEQAIGSALRTLCRNRTVVMVAHRLTSIRDADRIVVMAAGRVVQSGRHAVLAGVPGPYAALLAAPSVCAEEGSEGVRPQMVVEGAA